MNGLLDELHSYAVMLNKLGMLQAASDYDYIASWLRSVDLSNPSGHFGVIPAGKDTVAPRANNCPIPFTASIDLIRLCKNNQWAIGCLIAIYNILTELKKTYTSSHESLALKCFSKYTSEIAVLLGSEPIEPPEQETKIQLFTAFNKDTGEDLIYYTDNIPNIESVLFSSNIMINNSLSVADSYLSRWPVVINYLDGSTRDMPEGDSRIMVNIGPSLNAPAIDFIEK